MAALERPTWCLMGRFAPVLAALSAISFPVMPLCAMIQRTSTARSCSVANLFKAFLASLSAFEVVSILFRAPMTDLLSLRITTLLP